MAAVASSAADECSAPTGQLAGRLVVITGASRGVGAELARTFASEGALVVVNYYKSKDKAQAVVAEINHHRERHRRPDRPQALAVYGDVRVKADMEALVAKAEEHFAPAKVSVLVNNALQSYKFDPTSASASLRTVEWETIDAQMQGTVQGAVNAAQACLPSFEATKYGKVINVGTNLVYNPVVTYYGALAASFLSSRCSRWHRVARPRRVDGATCHAIDPMPHADYSAAKAALVSLTRNLAAELGPLGVRVNLVAGGLLERTDASSLTTDEVFGYVAGATPLRKTTTVEDFAKACVFFAAPASDAVTGQSLSVDGGLTMP